jgi:hypothetical protein
MRLGISHVIVEAQYLYNQRNFIIIILKNLMWDWRQDQHKVRFKHMLINCLEVCMINIMLKK